MFTTSCLKFKLNKENKKRIENDFFEIRILSRRTSDPPMEFPPKVLYPRRFQASPAQYTAEEIAAPEAAPDLRNKLATLVDRNKKVKMAYYQLQSQISFGLVEVKTYTSSSLVC